MSNLRTKLAVCVCVVLGAAQTVAAQATGACCQCSNGQESCSVSDAAGCEAAGGFYLGDDVSCDPLVIRTSNPSLVVEANLPTASDTMVIDESFEIGKVMVELEIDHTYVGDLCVTLQKESGEQAQLIKRMGGRLSCGNGCCGCPSNNLSITLRDDAASWIEDQCFWNPPALTGSFRPEEALTVFKGQDAAGAWTLSVKDGAQGDVGLVRSWSLLLLPKGAETATACKMMYPSCCECMSDAECDDGDPCTTDSCDAKHGCENKPVQCAEGEICHDGVCMLPPECWTDEDCKDGNACTIDACDWVNGCSHVNVDCSDNDACTVEGCDPQAGCWQEPLDCDDGDGCTIDSCDSSSGCAYAPMECPAGLMCLDGACMPPADPVMDCPPGESCEEIPNEEIPLSDRGKPCSVTLMYNGADCSATDSLHEAKKMECHGDPDMADSVFIVADDGKEPLKRKVWFQGTVGLEESFVASALSADQKKLKKKLYVHIFDQPGGQLLQTVKFEVENQKLYSGDQFGALTLEDLTPEGECSAASTSEPLGDPPAGLGESALSGLGKPCQMSLIYTGESCASSSHQQEPKKTVCSGDPGFADSVYILANKDKKPKLKKVWFEGQVGLNEAFVLEAAHAGKDKIDKKLYLHIFDQPGGELLQTVMFEVDPKDDRPLNLGDQFGSILVDDFVPKNHCSDDEEDSDDNDDEDDDD